MINTEDVIVKVDEIERSLDKVKNELKYQISTGLRDGHDSEDVIQKAIVDIERVLDRLHAISSDARRMAARGR